jgi:hypothetical protein
VTSTKQNVNASTGLVAAHSDTGQIFPARMQLTSAASSVTSAESQEAAPTGQALAVDRADRPAPSQAVDATSRVAATTAGTTLVDGTPVPGFGLIWPGRLSSSQPPTAASQWWWLRAQGVNTIVNLDAAMFDFAQYGFESFLWMPLDTGVAPTDESAARFLKFIGSCDNEPAHISGGTQENRATLIALLRYAVDAWTLEDALSEAERLNGGAALSPEQINWLLDWAATHGSGSERLASCSRH